MKGIGNTIYELKKVYGSKWVEIHVNTEEKKDYILSLFMYNDFDRVESTLYEYNGSTFRVILNYEMDNDYQILIDFK
jgi:hypothetical protein